ncbi:hypothetical protein CROQUDRAFT_655868 [Cronartium quercuum f. sp. fusiforme G11]|uniref:Uncharacterized protein n=1 Tax=Cronartium quercuum f. sp. fusiforme G11 TaxID=708437 RepID=A0A9P6NKI1_9BASI|nr:hypothetical protein CROQUDRAFT_655868 [Cronartium quercuum f. sp. fusiforme G11]
MMIAGLTKEYDQLDTYLAIKIAIQPMMDKLHLNFITKTEAHNPLSSKCKQLYGDNPFQLHHPD